MRHSRQHSVGEAFASVKKRLDQRDYAHLATSVVLVVAALMSFALNGRWFGWPLVAIVDVYLILLLVFAACRFSWLLPDRSMALLVVAFTFAALVLAFATLHGTCDCFTRRDIGVDPNTTAVTLSTTTLIDRWEAAYLSLGVITTAATDYVPADGRARAAVAAEIVSGLLFLIVAFPILAGRLALFEEATAAPGVPDGKFRVKKLLNNKWQVTVVQVMEIVKESDDALADEAEVVIEDGKVISVKKPS